MRTTDNANRDYVIKYLADKYGKNFAYGAGGNIDVETAGTFKPNMVQFGKGITNEAYTEKVDNGTYSKQQYITDGIGYSLWQVTSSGKKERHYNYAKEHGVSIGSMECALGWFDAEIPLTGYANVRKSIKENWSVEEVARIFCTEFERPRSMQMDAVTKENAIQERIRRALKLKELYEEEATEVVKPMNNIIKICLDAGHYGKYNRSPVVPQYYESDFTWAFTNYEKAELERLGFTVILTRTDKDKDLSLDKRGKASKGCQLFISNHSNACGTESVDRPVGIIPVAYKGTDVKNCQVLANRITDNIHKMIGTVQAGKVYSKDAGYDRNKDGTKGDDEYYGVMNGAQSVHTPMYMIVEHGFHTNKKTATWLLNDANVKALAIAEAKIIAQFLAEVYGTTIPVEDVPAVDIHNDYKAVTGTYTYVVQKGDVLLRIAKQFSVKLDDILALNPAITDPSKIYKGQKILIPASTNTIRWYTVKPDDTLSKIARKYTENGHKVAWQDIAKANNIAIPYTIRPNQTLIIP